MLGAYSSAGYKSHQVSLDKSFEASTPSFAFSLLHLILPALVAFQIYSIFRFPSCAGRISEIFNPSLPSTAVLPFLRWSHFRQIQIFAAVFFPPCAGRTSEIFNSSLPRFLLALAVLQTNSILLCCLSFLRWPHFRQNLLFTTAFFPFALAAFRTWDGDFRSNSMSSHILHNGEPLSSQGYPRSYDEAFHGKPFLIYARNRGLYSYTPAQILSSLIRYIEWLRNPDADMNTMEGPRKLQARGLLLWKELESGKFKWNDTKGLLEAYSCCFDFLFFGGLLKGLYKIKFVDPATIRGANGTCSWPRSFEHGFEIEITLSNRRGRESFESLDQPSQLRKYLGTLVHEMAHAVFHLYCCYRCSLCSSRYEYEVGTSGHSMVWQKLAMTIEDVLNQCPVFIGAVAFDLTRSRSFFLEYHGDEYFKPNIRLQNTLTVRQLIGLKLDGRTTRRIKGLLQVRDTQRAANRRKDVAGRRRKLKSKTEVQGGRVSKSNTPRSRH
jgi:hypothetical protein